MDTEETEESRSIRCAFTRADTSDVNPRGLTQFIFSMIFWSLILGGFAGALLAVPLTAAVKVLLRRDFWERKIKNPVIENDNDKDDPENPDSSVPAIIPARFRLSFQRPIRSIPSVIRRLTAILLTCAPFAQADLIATVQTDTGETANDPILVSLQYDTAPQAVANFIKLSQGTQERIDSVTGKIITDPMYIGETFFRILNSAGTKIAQTGSGTGTNNGGPGYTFRDEFTPSVRHTSYGLSMANRGPNSNGSQIFFTGGITHPGYDDVHSIIGIVTDLDSQGAIDKLLTGGNSGSAITGISIAADSGDAAAAAFDPDLQLLPTMSPAPGNLNVDTGISVTCHLSNSLQTGDLLSVYRSTDLQSWQSLGTPFAGYDSSPVASPMIDDGTKSRAFYQLARITHPDSNAPSHLRDRTIVTAFSSEVHTYVMNSEASGGTFSIQQSGGTFKGTFSIDLINHSAHQFGFIADTSFIWAPNLINIPLTTFVKCGVDTSQPTTLTGHHNTSYYDYGTNPPNNPGYRPFGKGACAVTR